MNTNYIIQLNNSFKQFAEDDKITPFHISLYLALFQKWNGNKFKNPISVARDEIMFLSKIGSANTYSKCLKELHAWGYIKYIPSHSYHVGSKIYMFNFNTTTKSTTNKTTNNASDLSNHKTNAKTSAQELRPYTNNIKTLKNKINKVNEQAHKNNAECDSSKRDDSSSALHEGKSTQSITHKSQNCSSEKTSGKINRQESFQKPTSQELISYFEEKDQPSTEAQKFFNYFESNGWLIGGKTPMKNWKAAANNWMLNAEKFNQEKSKPALGHNHPAGKLHTETNKNYNEPL